ncbi:class I adenylate-forming enzyme family protein [Natrarchaeobius chitinivorans]|nr:class I adenylate-forming enzyme family protein [Natrarchaeobius chitinivorans]
MQPLESWTVPNLFEQAVSRTPEATAIVDLETGREYTYAELDAETAAIASWFAEQGIGKGDRVAICLKNRPEHILTVLATQRIGAIAVPFNFRLAPEGIRYTLEHCRPAAFVYGPAVEATVRTLRPDLDVPIETYVTVATDPPSFATPFERLPDEKVGEMDVRVDPEDTSVILYSSGTTGRPKGIEINHAASAARPVINTIGQRFRLQTECMVGVMPLYHTVGLHGVVLTMVALSGTVLTLHDFEPEAVLDAIDEHGVTALHEAPTIFRALVDSPACNRTDAESIRVLTYSGAPMESPLLSEVIDAFDPAFVSNQYGCTEAFGPLGQIDLQDPDTAEPATDPTWTGPTNIMQQTRIVDSERKDPDAVLESGMHGELLISTASPTIFSGYWNDSEETESAVRDGWFFTGDMAYRTPDGNTVITGRVDDMIISGGENIYPAALEDVLSAHPAVASAAVVGTPDDRWGEVPKAYIVRADPVTADELDEWCLNRPDLAEFKRPREYEFVTNLPRNPSGKIKRYELHDSDNE